MSLLVPGFFRERRPWRCGASPRTFLFSILETFQEKQICSANFQFVCSELSFCRWWRVELPGGQARPTELPTPVPTAIPTIEPIQLPTITPIAGDSIQFETIALNLSGMDIMNLDPGQQLLLLTSEEDIQKITEWITPDTLENLQQISFIEFSVIALFRGYMPSLIFMSLLNKSQCRIVHSSFMLNSGNPHQIKHLQQ